jgi:hypothetical protein
MSSGVLEHKSRGGSFYTLQSNMDCKYNNETGEHDLLHSCFMSWGFRTLHREKLWTKVWSAL